MKTAIYRVLSAAFAVGGIAMLRSPAELAAEDSDCIYAERRDLHGNCIGLTVRICEGPPECPPEQS